MRIRFLMAVAVLWPALAAAQTSSDGQTAWEFFDRTGQDADKRLVSATASSLIDGQPASFMIACVAGKPAVTLRAPAPWPVRVFRYRFDEAPGRVVERVKTKGDIMVVDGPPARSFVRAAAKSKAVVVDYAAEPEARSVRYDLAGFHAGAAGLLEVCQDALK